MFVRGEVDRQNGSWGRVIKSLPDSKKTSSNTTSLSLHLVPEPETLARDTADSFSRYRAYFWGSQGCPIVSSPLRLHHHQRTEPPMSKIAPQVHNQTASPFRRRSSRTTAGVA